MEPIVQAEAIQALQQLHLFAPRHVNLSILVPKLIKALNELAKEDWVTFRSKTYRFDEFLSNWQEKLRNLPNNESTKSSKKHSSTNMNVRIQQDIENYRLITPLFKWVR